MEYRKKFTSIHILMFSVAMKNPFVRSHGKSFEHCKKKNYLAWKGYDDVCAYITKSKQLVCLNQFLNIEKVMSTSTKKKNLKGTILLTSKEIKHGKHST